MATAVVVGSGPNGLAAAVTLAEAGVSVRVLEAQDAPGGGARSSERTLPGLLHDDCSGFHPMGAASPFFRGQDLARYGLRWRWPEIQLAHPLDGGRAALLWRDLGRTVEGLGPDGRRWSETIGWTSRRFDRIAEEVLRPIIHLPRHPFALARFGSMAVTPASVLARAFRTEAAKALFGGVAAHSFSRLTTPFSSAVGVMLAAAGHAVGWPVAEGGTQAITDALVARLADLGGHVETSAVVTRIDDLRGADLVLLDTTPMAAATILRGRLPSRVARSYRRFRQGPAAYKLDLAVEGPIPWSCEDVGRAGTVHLGGRFEEMVAAEDDMANGRMPERPFCLLGQQYVADPSRSASGLNPVYLYAHVPHGHGADVTDLLLDQVERFAPGFRARVRHVVATGPAGLHSANANYVGGDIAGGASDGLQVLFRPRIALDPYSTGVDGVYLCSASTPPGAGVHGMGGYNAAVRALAGIGLRPHR
ncbi:MAG: NAD(P)/FAD-dependent oxidoreductase [Acidimicrobiales bacterium]|nr:NAD(P)/FAD-dependent oxidoreductase [Acidimicrobiales bacterium]